MFAQSNAASSPSYTNPSSIAFLLKSLDIKKASGLDKIPPELVKAAPDILSIPLSLAINNSLMNGIFPDAAKVAMISLIDKKSDEKNKISNYRPVSVLNIFSKVYEIVLKNAIASALNEYMYPFISAYREGYSTQHVLLRLIEEWWKNLDDDYIVGDVLMDLPKAFDCIPHDLLIAKLDSYGLDGNLLKYINLYLDNRKQCVCINNINSSFHDIISGVPQGSVVGPILFNAFFNDFFFFIQYSIDSKTFVDKKTVEPLAQHKVPTKNWKVVTMLSFWPNALF